MTDVQLSGNTFIDNDVLNFTEHRNSLQHAAHLVSVEDNRKPLNPRTLADAAS